MSVIDEKQEAIACIRMAVDNNNLAQLMQMTSLIQKLIMPYNTGNLDLQKERSQIFVLCLLSLEESTRNTDV
jgi:hypothetical protein